MQDATYPEREKFFAQRFHRLMAKLCVAQDVGCIGYALLSIIVSQEDSCRYRKVVTFYDTQLLPLLGSSSNSQLSKVRKKLVALGWLHYEQGKKGVASKYWVTIPANFEAVEDAGVADFDNGLNAPNARNSEGIGKELERQEKGIEKESEAHEVHSLPNNPNPYSTSPVDDVPIDRCIADYPIEVQRKADDIFQHRWLRLKGTLPNYELSQAKQELREIADKIQSFPDAHEKLKLYFASPPIDHGNTQKLWVIFKHLGFDPVASKTVKPSVVLKQSAEIAEEYKAINLKNSDPETRAKVQLVIEEAKKARMTPNG